MTMEWTFAAFKKGLKTLTSHLVGSLISLHITLQSPIRSDIRMSSLTAKCWHNEDTSRSGTVGSFTAQVGTPAMTTLHKPTQLSAGTAP